MKKDLLILAAKLLFAGLMVSACLWCGWRYVLYGALLIAAILVVLWLLFVAWHRVVHIKHDITDVRPRVRFLPRPDVLFKNCKW